MVHGVDVAGACFGTVALDAIVDGATVEPGDAVIGLPSSGLHSNGYTLARAALDGLDLGEDPEGGSAARSATPCSSRPRSTSSRSSSCCAPRSRSAASPTSPPAASTTSCGSRPTVGYEIDAPLPVPPIFDLIAERGDVADEEMHEVFNMGCGFCVVVPAERRGRGPRAAARPLPERRADRPRHRRPGEVVRPARRTEGSRSGRRRVSPVAG